MIKIQDLHKKYGAKEVLKGINLTLQKGKIYGIVGENGAGKTTLFRCIVGLEKHQGSIESDFMPLKNHLGFFPTNPYFFPKITGHEYLQLLCNARNIKVKDLDSKNIFDLPLQQYAITYSTGMKKKLALTALLLQHNDYFILDEPFNGVDIQSNIIITEIIQQLKTLNKIVLISSHIFSTLKTTCDEIHLLQNGLFTKSVQQADFEKLEREMIDVTIGNSIAQLELR